MKSKVRQTNTILLGFFYISCLLLALLMIAGWYYVVTIGQVANRITTQTANLESEADQLSALSLKYKRVLPEKGLVLDALPKDKDISVFLADFENLAKADNLTITSSLVGDTTAKSKGDLSQTLSQSNYYALPISYQVSGNFSDFSKFIQDTSTLRRLNTMSDLNLNTDASSKTSDKIMANFKITVYLKQG